MSTASEAGAGPKNPKARTFFQHGNEATLKNNLDYAIQMYQEACKIEPEHLLCRQALRVIERRKFGNEPSKVGRLVGMRTQPIRMRARSAKSKGHWAQAIEICEEAFVHNPWDVHAAWDAAEASVQLELKELAQWFIDSVASVANEVDFFKYAATVYELNGSWPKAIASWERVKQINPDDEEASRQMNSISASATIQRSGLGEALHRTPEGSSGPGRDAATRAAELEELRQPKLSPEERWLKEIEESPEHVGPYLQFAEHLKSRGKLDDAEKLLSKGLKTLPDDPSLQSAYAEVQIDRLQHAIAGWTRKAQQAPGDTATQAKLAKLQGMLLDYEIKEYRRRSAQNPGDFNLIYELGLRLSQAGKYKDAIAAFQSSRSSPTLKVQSLHQAGLCFEAEGALKLAERSYQEAIKAVEPDDFTNLNALHYRLGRVAEALGNTAAAEEHYNEVAANDYGYLDVAQRLRSLN